MKHELRAPCNECPFRREHPAGELGPWEPRDLLGSLAYQPFPCHLTIPQVWQPNDMLYDELQTCAGAAIYLNNKSEMSRCPETKAHQDLLGASPAVFACADEFLAHHEELPIELEASARAQRKEERAA